LNYEGSIIFSAVAIIARPISSSDFRVAIKATGPIGVKKRITLWVGRSVA
jgi:hypothetical protein